MFQFFINLCVLQTRSKVVETASKSDGNICRSELLSNKRCSFDYLLVVFFRLFKVEKMSAVLLGREQ